MFILQNNSHALHVLIYVDDIIITGTNSSIISDFTFTLHNYFSVKDLGTLHFFLGLEVDCNTSSLFLSKAQCITNLPVQINMHNYKSVTIPMSSSLKLLAFDGVSFEDPISYRSAIRSLQYLAFTWPVISFVINKV